MADRAVRVSWVIVGLCTLICLLAAASRADSALAAPAVAVSPLNGTPDASPYAQISFLGVPAEQINDVRVVGSRSGGHSGHLKAYATAAGASFLPNAPFVQGERVTATAIVGPKGHASPVQTTFTVARFPAFHKTLNQALSITGHGLVQTFHSVPSLQPPVVQVTTNNAGAGQGDIFLTPTHGYGQAGDMILDPQGRLIWFHPVPKGDTATNFEVQSYRGEPVLTWWEGQIANELGVGFGQDEIVNDQYKPVATVRAGNGYEADLHEFQLTPQGSAFITAYTLVDANLSSVGGSSNGVLQDAVLQEIDVPTGLVMFEWHAYGHVALGDSFSSPSSNAEKPWDFFHMNSVSLDPWGDGNFVISSRNTWTAYEVNHVTGAVLWRLGGRHSSFKMGAGTGTAWQHDVQWQSDGTLTIFDNGASPKVHSESRALREQIDWPKKTVTLVSRLSGKILSGSQGDVQLQPDGSYFVGWGEVPYLTEYSPTGQVLFNAHFPNPGQSYRAFRFDWSAAPASRPAVAVSAVSGAATVYVSWNGATGVAAWQVLAGPSSSSLTPVASAPRNGFETSVPVSGSYAYYAVEALDSSGHVLGVSAAVKG